MRLKVLGCLMLCFLASACENRWKPSETEGLYIYSRNDKYGFTGLLNGSNVTIEAKFDFLAPFSEGLAVAEIRGRQGYIGLNGEWVIQPIYTKAYSFSEGMARVEVPGPLGIGKKIGFINRKGDMVLSGTYDDASDFLHGEASVRIGYRRWRIDPFGNPIQEVTNFIFRHKERNF